MTIFLYGVTVVSIVLIIILYAFGTRAFALPGVNIGPIDQTYNLTIGNQIYPLRYGFSAGSVGFVESMTANVSSKSITIIVTDNSTDSISDWQKRIFSIDLPRNIINANSTESVQGCGGSVNGTEVWNQLHDLDYNIGVYSVGEFDASTNYDTHMTIEGCDRDKRTLSIEYPSGKSMIVIQGTVMIPEFGPSTFVLSVVALSMMSGILVFRSSSRNSKEPRF